MDGELVQSCSPDASFAGRGEDDQDCIVIDELDGVIELSCFAPANLGVARRGVFKLKNSAIIGALVTFDDGWTYTGTRNESDHVDEADYCVLLGPATTTSTSGADFGTVWGRVYEEGVTESAGASVDVLYQVGLGPFGTNPALDAGWVFVTAPYLAQVLNDDEYGITLPAPVVQTETSFAYTSRVSFDTGLSYSYCDLDGAGSNIEYDFDADSLGVVVVQP